MAQENTPNTEEVISPIDILMDPDNDANVVLFNEDDEAVEFEQVAIIPINDDLYAILKPVDEYEGVADDEAIVFAIHEEGEDHFLDVEQDEAIIDQVFARYFELYDEANGEITKNGETGEFEEDEE